MTKLQKRMTVKAWGFTIFGVKSPDYYHGVFAGNDFSIVRRTRSEYSLEVWRTGPVTRINLPVPHMPKRGVK